MHGPLGGEKVAEVVAGRAGPIAAATDQSSGDFFPLRLSPSTAFALHAARGSYTAARRRGQSLIRLPLVRPSRVY